MKIAYQNSPSSPAPPSRHAPMTARVANRGEVSDFLSLLSVSSFSFPSLPSSLLLLLLSILLSAFTSSPTPLLLPSLSYPSIIPISPPSSLSLSSYSSFLFHARTLSDRLLFFSCRLYRNLCPFNLISTLLTAYTRQFGSFFAVVTSYIDSVTP